MTRLLLFLFIAMCNVSCAGQHRDAMRIQKALVDLKNSKEGGAFVVVSIEDRKEYVQFAKHTHDLIYLNIPVSNSFADDNGNMMTTEFYGEDTIVSVKSYLKNKGLNPKDSQNNGVNPVTGGRSGFREITADLEIDQEALGEVILGLFVEIHGYKDGDRILIDSDVMPDLGGINPHANQLRTFDANF